MAPDVDQLPDSKAVDNNSTALKLITDVNQFQSGGAKDTTMVDYLKAGAAKTDAVFGTLAITGGDHAGPALLKDNYVAKADGVAPKHDVLNVKAKDLSPEAAVLSDAKAMEKMFKDPDVKAKHDELVKQAKEHMSGDELKKFTDNLDKFEAREAINQREYEKQFEAKGMSPEKAAKEAEKKAHQEVKDTFNNVEKLLAHNPKAPVSDADRTQLAKQVMLHAANPSSISQGGYETCTVSSAETRAFDKDPAEASRLVAEVATTGQYTRPGHAPVKLDAESLKKQGEAKDKTSDEKDNKRDYASQLFEVTAVNIILQHRNESTNPPGQIRYEQHKPDGSKAGDTGERMYDYSKNPPKELPLDVKITPYDISYVSKQISPKGGESTVAITSINQADIGKQIVELEFETHGLGKIGNTSDANWAKKAHDTVNHSKLTAAEKTEINSAIDTYEADKKRESDPSVAHVHNAEELKKVLAKAQENGELPVVIQVNTNHEPFWSDSGGGAAGGSGGEHMVTITGFDKNTGTVTIRNQWGASADHTASASDIFDATKDPKGSVPDLQKEVNSARNSGHRDYVKEYELLRLEQQYNLITDSEFEKQAAQVSIDRAKDHHNGKITNAEFEASSKEWGLMVGILRETNPNLVKKLANDVNDGLEKLGYNS